MLIEIYQGASRLYAFPSVLTASLTDRLSGERTLDFSVLASRSQKLVPGMTAQLDGQVYSIVRVARQISNGLPITAAQCEHISYLLNDEKYALVTFVYEGTPLGGLNRLLSGTPFSVGVCEAAASVEVAFTEGTLNRRNALMRFIDACGCEVEYDGYKINLRKHRGSSVRKVLMDGRNVTGLSVTLDSRENTQAYEIALFKMADLEAGDEVNITYRPMGVAVDTRIVAITYNPFYRYTVRVEVGDYVPNLLAAAANRMEGIKQEFRAANGRLESTIQKMDGSLSSLRQTVSGFDTRITTAEGNVSTLRQTVSGFDTRITTAEGAVSQMSQTVSGFDARIKSAEGNVAQLSLTVGGFNTRITATEDGLKGAETHISSIEQYAKSIRLSVTNGETSSSFKLTAGSTTLSSGDIKFTGFVTFAGLTGGTTTIDGACIKTGTISADRIDAANLHIKKIYGSNDKMCVGESGSSTLYVGGDGGWNYDTLRLFAYKLITLSDCTGVANGVKLDLNARTMTSSVLWELGSSSTPWGKTHTGTQTIYSGTTAGMTISYYQIYSTQTSYLGTSSYPWNYAYITTLYLNGTQFKPGDYAKTSDLSSYAKTSDLSSYAKTSDLSSYAKTSDLSAYAKTSAIYRLYAGGSSTTYYLTYNSSRQLVPSNTGSSYGSYIGTSSYPFYWGYFTGLTIQGGTLNLGTSAAKLAFFGVTAQSRKSVSSVSTSGTLANAITGINNVITALKSYGLFS